MSVLVPRLSPCPPILRHGISTRHLPKSSSSPLPKISKPSCGHNQYFISCSRQKYWNGSLIYEPTAGAYAIVITAFFLGTMSHTRSHIIYRCTETQLTKGSNIGTSAARWTHRDGAWLFMQSKCSSLFAALVPHVAPCILGQGKRVVNPVKLLSIRLPRSGQITPGRPI
jgi:hypothetical protein